MARPLTTPEEFSEALSNARHMARVAEDQFTTLCRALDHVGNTALADRIAEIVALTSGDAEGLNRMYSVLVATEVRDNAKFTADLIAECFIGNDDR